VKKIALSLLVLAMPSMALGLERRDGAYYCTEKFSGGVRYDNTLNQWHGATFKADENFVVKLSQTKPPPEEQDDPDARDRYYFVTIAVEKEGRSSRPCVINNYKPPFIDTEGLLRCEVMGGLEIYIFNFNNHRFIEIYIAGYVDGSNNDTPHVAGGLCTKISQ
jgi:hypothetical protein